MNVYAFIYTIIYLPKKSKGQYKSNVISINEILYFCKNKCKLGVPLTQVYLLILVQSEDLIDFCSRQRLSLENLFIIIKLSQYSLCMD
jgi:hypothetical protein